MESSKSLVCMTSMFWHKACQICATYWSYCYFIIFQSSKFPFFLLGLAGGGRAWVASHAAACFYKKVSRRDENGSFKCSRFFSECCSFRCIILSYIENNHVSPFPLERSFHFAQMNNNVSDGSGTICIQGLFPAANAHPVV